MQDEGGHLKIGEYWIQMLYEQIHPNQDSRQNHDSLQSVNIARNDTKKDVQSFGSILYQMLEGRHVSNVDTEWIQPNFADSEKKLHLSRCPGRIVQLIENCMSDDPFRRPSFEGIIVILEEVSLLLGKAGCPVC